MNKQINADSRISDRFIYNEAVSIKNTLVKQEANRNRIYDMTTLFKTINRVELIDVDTVEACDIDSDCKIKRSKHKLPKIIETSGGFIIRSVASLDGSQTVFFTTDLAFRRKIGTNDKHGKKEKVAFIRNDYLYLPNSTWPFVKIEAMFEDPDEAENLNACDEETIVCTPAYERGFPIPNYLEGSLKQLLNESLLRYYHQLREDNVINKQND